MLKNGINARIFDVGKIEINRAAEKKRIKLIKSEGMLFLNRVEKKIDIVMKINNLIRPETTDRRKYIIGFVIIMVEALNTVKILVALNP